METFKILILGNSAAGLSAAKEFRKYDTTSSICMLSKEGCGAYSRVLLPYVLSKRLPYEKLLIAGDEFYRQYGIDCRQGEVVAVDTAKKSISLSCGQTLIYEKLLIATGASPVMPPIEGLHGPSVMHMWTRDDLRRLMDIFKKDKLRAVVVGSGFVALQAAQAAQKRGYHVSVIEIAQRVMPTVLNPDASALMCSMMGRCGVDVHTDTILNRVAHLERGVMRLHLNTGDAVDADIVIVGAGVRPNTAFLEGSGVNVKRAVPVDRHMCTNVPDVYAAGDAAAGPTVFGQEHEVHALWPTAVEMGGSAGANMASHAVPYAGSLNMNITHMFGVTVASVGITDPDIADSTVILNTDSCDELLSVSYKDGALCGGCSVGTVDYARLLGKLKGAIRKHMKIDCVPNNLERCMDIMASAHASRGTGR